MRNAPRLRAIFRCRPRITVPTARHFSAAVSAAGTATAKVSHLPRMLLLFAAITTTANADSPSWNSLLDELQQAQNSIHSPPPFTAARRPLQSGKSVYQLHFAASPEADILTLIINLSSLIPLAKFQVHESPTRTILSLSDENANFEVSIPRLAPFETSIALRFTRPSDDPFTEAEVDTLVHAYQLMHSVEPFRLLDGKHSVDIGPATVIDRGVDDEVVGRPRGRNLSRARQKLEELGVEVFDSGDLTWDALAGYADVKKRIDDTLTLPLKHPEVYQSIVRGTRKRYESNLPKAVLYEGPPGCGKTLSAKILAASIGVPFVHVPLETILSKFYGETTRKLAEILQTANELGRCLVFIDECDSIGMSRSSSTEIHEVTRRTLSVLLRHIDGMDGPQNTILLAATNHKEDIDPALMSRFDVVVSFPLPDHDTRQKVLALYAKHLNETDLKTMADLSSGFSGRELLDICEEAERMHGGNIVRGRASGESVKGNQLPALEEYVEAIRRKAPHIVGREWERGIVHKRDSKIQSRTNGPAPAVAT